MDEPTRDVDDLIREALADEHGEAAGDLGDPSLIELLTETFRGRHRWYAILGVVVNLVLAVIGVTAAVAFVRADDVRSMLLCGGAAGLSFALVLVIKIWYWLEMTRLALSRELKRVELQIVQLARRMSR